MGAVILMEASKQNSDSVEGMVSPRPPNLTGSASNKRSVSEQGGRPVSPGINFSLITTSRGPNIWPISGMVREMYDHLVAKP